MSDGDARQSAGSAPTAWVVGGLLTAGPYAGLTVNEVALRDPRYLTRLVASGVGGEELRIAALAAPEAEPDGRRGRHGRPSTTLAGGPAGVAAWRGALVALAAVALGFALAPRALGLRATSGPAPGAEPSPSAAARAVASGARTSTAARPGGPTARTPVATVATPAAAWDAAAPCGKRAAGSLPASDVAGAVGTFQGVEFRVASTKDTGKVTFLNSHDPYQGYFYVAVFPDDYASFPRPPAEHFAGKCVVAQGTIELYKGTPQIVLQHPTDIVVVGD